MWEFSEDLQRMNAGNEKVCRPGGGQKDRLGAELWGALKVSMTFL